MSHQLTCDSLVSRASGCAEAGLVGPRQVFFESLEILAGLGRLAVLFSGQHFDYITLIAWTIHKVPIGAPGVKQGQTVMVAGRDGFRLWIIRQ